MKITNQQPLVSIIMTAYNADKYINQAVLSILTQTYGNFEFIIVNDGSTDNTGMILKNLAHTDTRIKIFDLKNNRGPSTASNIALKKARGNFVARMDADDIAIPTRIERQVEFLLSNPEIVIVGSKCLLINENGKIIGEKNYPLTHDAIYNSLFTMNPIQHPTCMINRDLLPRQQIRYHNHSLLAHDLELIFEIAQYGKLANLNEPLLLYRQRENSLSLKNPKATFKATVQVRMKALKRYKYKPNAKSWLIHSAQNFTVALLPSKAVYPIFKFARMKMSLKQSHINLMPLRIKMPILLRNIIVKNG